MAVQQQASLTHWSCFLGQNAAGENSTVKNQNNDMPKLSAVKNLTKISAVRGHAMAFSWKYFHAGRRRGPNYFCTPKVLLSVRSKKVINLVKCKKGLIQSTSSMSDLQTVLSTLMKYPLYPVAANSRHRPQPWLFLRHFEQPKCSTALGSSQCGAHTNRLIK